MKDAIESVTEGIKLRFSDPILGAYVISFLIWNWQIIFHSLAGDVSATERITQIHEYLYQPVALGKIFFSDYTWNNFFSFLYSLLIYLAPLFFTAAYIFLPIKYFKLIYKYIDESKVTRNNIGEEAKAKEKNIAAELARLKQQAQQDETFIKQQETSLTQLQAALENSNHNYTAAKERIKILEEENKDLKEERQKPKAKPAPALDIIQTSLKKLNIQDPYNLSVDHFAKKQNISINEAEAEYKKLISSLLAELKQARPSSNRLKQIENMNDTFVDHPNAALGNRISEFLTYFDNEAHLSEENKSRVILARHLVSRIMQFYV